MKTGRYNISQLLTAPEIEQIVIPELQRDYVWKKRNVRGLLSSILGNFNSKETQILNIKDGNGDALDSDIEKYLSEEYMRLRYNTRIGFIYAYHDLSLPGQYYLIDGQQRITTIFLLLLSLYKTFDPQTFRNKYFHKRIPKLDYKVREIAHDFLVDFIEFELSQNDGEKFEKSNRYYIEYDTDITCKSILSNYNVIVKEVEGVDAAQLIDYVENYVEFNYFDTNMSQQGEKLYLYMNSRGEPLSVQERIKSIIVSRSNDKLKSGEYWEDWQNFFWRLKSPNDENADRGFFEFIKWAVIMHLHTYPPKSIEEIEDYIRIEKNNEKKTRQEDLISTYVTENKDFTFLWLQQVEQAVERLHVLIHTSPAFRLYGFSGEQWFNGCDNTIDYVALIGVLYYIVLLPGATDLNVLRMAMYLKNLKSEYTLRRNPDRAVIRCMDLIRWCAINGIVDVRLIGKYFSMHSFDFSDTYVLRPDDLRFGYYLIDWQESQSAHPKCDEIGRWETFFWSITNDKELNDFLRGNHDFIIRLMRHGGATPEEYLERFKNKIYQHRNSDELRRSLLKYGDISIYDYGGSWKLKIWMERWCMLRNERDEPYWDKFMTGDNAEKNATIVANYLFDNTAAMAQDYLLDSIGTNLDYMTQKYYLWYEKENERTRVVLLKAKQAAENKARELCIQELHKQISESWVWQYNFCVFDFKPSPNGLVASKSDQRNDYYIDIWYDWFPDGGKWYCRIGHRLGGTLPEAFVDALRDKVTHICNTPIEWICDDESKLIAIKNPIYFERPDEDYFSGTKFAKQFFDELWGILQDMNAQRLLNETRLGGGESV